MHDRVRDHIVVSIRAARAGGDPRPRPVRPSSSMLFQSAPPARAATEDSGSRTEACPVSIRAARAGGDLVVHIAAAGVNTFQSAPPARAATRVSEGYHRDVDLFQSAPPARAATRARRRGAGRGRSFNPRRPRGRRRDGPAALLAVLVPRFNPRRPRGRRREGLLQVGEAVKFQSAPPARAATASDQRAGHQGHRVSIRAARAGGDMC